MVITNNNTTAIKTLARGFFFGCSVDITSSCFGSSSTDGGVSGGGVVTGGTIRESELGVGGAGGGSTGG